MKKFGLISLLILLLAGNSSASVVSEYALNSYDNHVLGRAEKKCVEEGYKITYAGCDNQTAPVDRCPHHDDYYRSCSQEQWCRNNNYTFLAQDCEMPSYPVKICDNNFEIYRACQNDPEKACKEQGYKSETECTLSEERCEFDEKYGKCCDDCPDYPYAVDSIPAGYVADGETCKTCSGIIKTKVIEAPCTDFFDCDYGPASPKTASCQKGEKILYSLCKQSEDLCREKGYYQSACGPDQDEEACPEQEKLKKCKINCYKFAKVKFSDSDVIAKDETNPAIDSEKTGLLSLYGKISEECEGTIIPTVTLNLNKETYPLYRQLFNRNIENINFVIDFQDKFTLEAGGNWKNVRIKVSGTPEDCAFSGKNIIVSEKVSISGDANICADIQLADNSKFTTSKDVIGNVTMGGYTQLGIKGNLQGSLLSKSYTEIFIKGKVTYKNKLSNTPDAEGIVFGCNSRVKIVEGIEAETANVIAKQYSLIDTPSITVISKGASDGASSSIHLHRQAKVTSIMGDSEYGLIDNTEDISRNCDDKYVINRASTVNGESSSMSLNTADSLDGQWQCQQLTKQQLKCN